MAERIDKELEEFRKIMEVPSRFDEGFRWSSLFGALFIALLMVPGGIYMGLLAGAGMGRPRDPAEKVGRERWVEGWEESGVSRSR